MAQSKPNIIYLHSHDTGRYVQPYGYAVPAPNIQKLAETGVLFRHAHCAAPTCSPSRAALLTGQWPHSCGQFGLANRGFYLPDCSKHIVNTLRRAGYRSALIGIQHIVKDPRTIGYDQVPEKRIWAAKDVAPAAVEFLESSPKEPFFLSCGFGETHRVFHKKSLQENPRYCRPAEPFPDTAETREDMARYTATARVLDQGYGAVLGSLEDTGLAGNTLVICTTDHGIAFPNMKCNLTAHGTGVMLIIRGPGGFTGGKALDSLVSQIDIFPTVCDLIGLAAPSWLQGKSLMPLLRPETEEINDAVFSEVNYHGGYEPMRCVRTKRWSYIRRFHPREKPFLANCDAGYTKSLLLEHGWKERAVPPEALHDLVFDPTEACNLAADAAYKKVLEEMRDRLDGWMRDTDDPLLRGEIPLPDEAYVSRPDDTDPFDIWTYTQRPKGLA